MPATKTETFFNMERVTDTQFQMIFTFIGCLSHSRFLVVGRNKMKEVGQSFQDLKHLPPIPEIDVNRLGQRQRGPVEKKTIKK